MLQTTLSPRLFRWYGYNSYLCAGRDSFRRSCRTIEPLLFYSGGSSSNLAIPFHGFKGQIMLEKFGTDVQYSILELLSMHWYIFNWSLCKGPVKNRRYYPNLCPRPTTLFPNDLFLERISCFIIISSAGTCPRKVTKPLSLPVGSLWQFLGIHR